MIAGRGGGQTTFTVRSTLALSSLQPTFCPQGGLMVGFSLSGVSAHLVIPAEELETLRRGLDQTRTIRDTLSARPPPQGAH
jgi:hypothetical protein